MHLSRGFIKDIHVLENMLIDSGESEVFDIKLSNFAHSMTFLYIKGKVHEYLIKLYATDGHGELIPQIKFRTLYSVEDVMDAITTILDEDGFMYGKGLMGESR
jgi:hypothetical protein